jgi:protein SCO1
VFSKSCYASFLQNRFGFRLSSFNMKWGVSCVVLLLSLTVCRAESWKVKGAIESVSEEEKKWILAHEGIRGLVDEAGTLEVQVSSGDYAILGVGDLIRGTLVKAEEAFSLETVWPGNPEAIKSMTLINRDLTRPRIGQQTKGLLRQGDQLPRFAMYNQLGELVTPDRLEGRLVVMNFVFTRSDVPSMSPATTDRMAELQDRLLENGYGNEVRIISLSLDPDFDTPGVCYTYLDEREVDHSGFWMLTGDKKTLEFIRKQIGVVASPSQKTIINHSMVTLIADREGKVFYRKPGSRWEVDDIYDRLEILLMAR